MQKNPFQKVQNVKNFKKSVVHEFNEDKSKQPKKKLKFANLKRA